MISYCSEKGLPPMVRLGKVFRGDVLAGGRVRGGHRAHAGGIAELRSIGTVFSVPS